MTEIEKEQIKEETTQKAGEVATTKGLTAEVEVNKLVETAKQDSEDTTPENKRLIVVSRKEQLIGWDYPESIIKVRHILKNWKDNTTDLVQELFIARTQLKSQGKRTDKKDNETDVPKLPTWGKYCDEIGISKRHANRLIKDYLAKEPSDEDIKPEVSKATSQTITCPISGYRLDIICKTIKNNGETTYRHSIKQVKEKTEE